MHKRGSPIKRWRPQHVVDLVHKLRKHDDKCVEPFPLVQCLDEAVRWNA